MEKTGVETIGNLSNIPLVELIRKLGSEIAYEVQRKSKGFDFAVGIYIFIYICNMILFI